MVTPRTRLGRYVDLVPLGQGGMGAVYRGRDPELEREVAIKVMLQADPDFVARFRREAQAIARLVHPNIVQVYDFGVDEENNPYFVMELVSGMPLDRLLGSQGKLDPALALGYLRQAADGLAAAHRAGIVHRDIKPANLVLNERGVLKLVDFGIARVSSGASPLTVGAVLMGTPGYLAPEVADGHPADGRADIYALGLTLWELLAGRAPYTAEDPVALIVRSVKEPLPDLRAVRPGLPEALVQLTERLSAKDLRARPQTMEAVLAEIDVVLQQLTTSRFTFDQSSELAATSQVSAREVALATPSPRADAAPTSPTRLPLVLGLSLLVIVGAGLAMSLRTPPPPPVVVPPADPVAVEKPGKSGPLRVAVLKFRNLSTDEALGMLETGIAETAVTQLVGRVKDVMLLERTDLDSDISELDRAGDPHFDALSVARRGQLQGVEFAIQGAIQQARKTLRITARLVRVENGEVLDTYAYSGPADVFAAQDQVAAGLTAKLEALARREKR